MRSEYQRENEVKKSNFGFMGLPGLFAVAHALEHIYAYVLPPLFPLLRNELSLSYTQVGLLGTVRDIIRGILQFPIGVLTDIVGHYRLLTIGFLGMSVACFLMGLAQGYFLLVLLQIMSGVASSSFHPSTYALIVDNTEENKIGKSVAIHNIGGNLGNAIVFLLMATLAAMVGWRWSLIIVALPGFIMTYIFYIAFMKKKWYEDVNKDSTEKCNGQKKPKNLKAIVIITIISTLMGMYGRSIPIFLPLYFFEVYASSVVEAGFIGSMFFVGGFISILAGGVLADKYDKVLIIFIVCLVTGLLILLFTFIQMNIIFVVILVAIIGMVRVMGNPARNAIAADITPKGGRGFIYGLMFSGNFLGSSAMTIVLGLFSDVYGIKNAFLLLGVLSCVTAFLSLSLKRHLI